MTEDIRESEANRRHELRVSMVVAGTILGVCLAVLVGATASSAISAYVSTHAPEAHRLVQECAK